MRVRKKSKSSGVLGTLAAVVLALAPSATEHENRASAATRVYLQQQDKKGAQKAPLPAVSDDKIKAMRKPYEAMPEYKAKDPKFFNLLYTDAFDSKNDLDTRFVLLEFSREYAEMTSNVNGAFRAIDSLDEIFDGVRPVAKKCGILNKMRAKGRSPEHYANLADQGFALIDEVLAKGDFMSAREIITNVKKDAAAGRDKQLEQIVDFLSKDISDLEKEYFMVISKEFDDALTAGNPLAHQEGGMYLYFALKKPKDGLDYLVKAADPALKHAAELERDLGNTPSVADLRKVADAWYETIKTVGKNKLHDTRIKKRAYALLKAAYAAGSAPEQRALDQDKDYQKRLKELAAVQRPGIPINLLGLVDFQKDKVKGMWELRDGILSSPPGDHNYVQFPFYPGEEYTIAANVKMTGDLKQVYFGLPIGEGKQVHLILEPRPDQPSIIELKSGVINLPKTVPTLIKKGQPCTIVCDVKPSSLKVSIDAKVVYDGKLDPAQLRDFGLLYAPDVKALTYATSTQYDCMKLTYTSAPGSSPGRKTR